MVTDKKFIPNVKSEETTEWLSISDMMTGLMVIFLFIAISYMIHIQARNRKMLEIAETYAQLHEDLYKDLLEEFKDDLSNWSAHIDSSSLSITFTEPDVLFNAGSSRIRPRFQDILKSFFPRYVDILTKEQYKDDIAEVRIEGHTSSEWQDLPQQEAYFYNMDLSQRRTRAVLKFVMDLVADNKELTTWLKYHFTANGLSSSKLIFNENNEEDPIRSRRVEFRVRTNAEKRIANISRVGG